MTVAGACDTVGRVLRTEQSYKKYKLMLLLLLFEVLCSQTESWHASVLKAGSSQYYVWREWSLLSFLLRDYVIYSDLSYLSCLADLSYVRTTAVVPNRSSYLVPNILEIYTE